MLQEERFNKILTELSNTGAVKNVNLIEMLNVSESTIRRDISELDRMGKLKKVFGGAVQIKKSVNTLEEDILTKSAVNINEKQAIARYAASLIKDNDFIFIDAGTTTERMIDYIDNPTATYMTNGIIHAQKLAQKGLRVNVIGGKLKGRTLSVIGVGAVKSIENYNFTKCFMGTNGVDLEKGFTTPDLDEAVIKEGVIKHSNEVYILADASKFDKVYATSFAQLKGSCIITDKLINTLYKKHATIKEVE